ncbi:MAG: hypothetical protein JXA69_12900 [Phycisphaerae bacterium]|nr:hypothetical protein [Phycisphaerae bacterium]
MLVKRMPVALVLFCCMAAPCAGQKAADIVVATVTGASEIEPVVAIDRGREHGVAMADPVAFVDPADPAKLIAAGAVFVLDDETAAVRVTGMPADRGLRLRAFIIPASTIELAKRRMPAGTTLRGHVTGLAPGRRQVWIDRGLRSGLADGDTFWVLRNDFPIAHGRIVVVRENVSLLQCRPLVANAIPEVGDPVQAWPSPAMSRAARLESVILDAAPSADGVLLTLAGAGRDGFRPDRQVELFAGSDYVGLASIVTSSDRLCVARALPAFCTTRPAPGMRALARPVPAEGATGLEARIFDVRPDYVLISAGYADGVRVGETFAVVRKGEVVGRLEVEKVNVDFAGAVPLAAEADPVAPSPVLEKWDRVVREPLPAPAVQRVGTVAEVWRDGEWLGAELATSPERLEPGMVLRTASEPSAASLVVYASSSHALLYIPPAWGTTTILRGQPVERFSD